MKGEEHFNFRLSFLNLLKDSDVMWSLKGFTVSTWRKPPAQDTTCSCSQVMIVVPTFSFSCFCTTKWSVRNILTKKKQHPAGLDLWGVSSSLCLYLKPPRLRICSGRPEQKTSVSLRKTFHWRVPLYWWFMCSLSRLWLTVFDLHVSTRSKLANVVVTCHVSKWLGNTRNLSTNLDKPKSMLPDCWIGNYVPPNCLQIWPVRCSKNKVSPRTQKQHLFLAVGMVEVDRRIRLAAVRHVLERYTCRYESNPFNLTFLNISEHNEACLRLTLKHASYTASAHPRLPPFSPGSSPSATPSTSISWIFQTTTKHVWD